MENFFTRAQGKRIQATAMGHPPEIAKPYVFAGMLIWKAMQLSVELKDVDKAKEQVVDWYCNASSEEVENEIQSTLKDGITIEMIKETLEQEMP
ncbi:hypothetical protein [Prochlorococcus sp. MIT 1300]|uniref:hypothetical protein n=1 Tax=Prochlorococcus sp. MIT 1300 TaxID=3096218 RepID=UPI002A75EE92|nr:hypothetical protein [Prochlorococcus sp. MIT 1300]